MTWVCRSSRLAEAITAMEGSEFVAETLAAGARSTILRSRETPYPFEKGQRAHMSSWREVVARPEESHVVQIYRDASFLHEAVAGWLAPSLRAGGGAIVFGTPTSTAGILGQLRHDGLPVDALIREGRLALLDAETSLAAFMKGERPDPAAARELVGRHGVSREITLPW